MTQTATRIGNSVGVVIPIGYRKKMGIKSGTKLATKISADGKTMHISRIGISSSSVTPDFIEILEGVNKRYGPALAKLANL